MNAIIATQTQLTKHHDIKPRPSAWLLLKEIITLRLLIGASFIILGLFVIAKK
jgi:hypothetical protein